MNYQHSICLTKKNVKQSQIRQQRAFTLVEMLIAIVLSSIIFVSAYQVISHLIQYQVRARAQHESQMDKLLLTNLLSQVIEKSIHQFDLLYRIPKLVIFQGNADSIRLISRAYSDNFDQPGHRVYRLYQQEGELYVDYRQYDADYMSNQQFKLASGLKIKAITFEYLDENNWVDEWEDDKSIPQYIRITVEQSGNKLLKIIRSTGRR